MLDSNKTIEVDIVLSCCSNKSPIYVTGELWISDALNKYPALIDIKSWRTNIHYINCKEDNTRRHRTYAEPWLIAFLIRHDIETFEQKLGVLDQVELTFYDSSSRPQPNVRVNGCLMYTIGTIRNIRAHTSIVKIDNPANSRRITENDFTREDLSVTTDTFAEQCEALDKALIASRYDDRYRLVEDIFDCARHLRITARGMKLSVYTEEAAMKYPREWQNVVTEFRSSYESFPPR